MQGLSLILPGAVFPWQQGVKPLWTNDGVRMNKGMITTTNPLYHAPPNPPLTASITNPRHIHLSLTPSLTPCGSQSHSRDCIESQLQLPVCGFSCTPLTHRASVETCPYYTPVSLANSLCYSVHTCPYYMTSYVSLDES